MKMFSEEWWKAVSEKLKTDEQFHEKAKGLAGNIHFIVRKDPKGKLNEDVELGVKIPEGEPWWKGPKPIEELDIIMEGKAGSFVDVITGKKNPVIALSMGSLRLKKGGLGTLTANIGGVLRLIEVLGTIPTEQ